MKMSLMTKVASHPLDHPVLTLTLILGVLSSLSGPELVLGGSALRNPDSSPLQYNVWTEDRQAIRKPEDQSTLYARERHCKAPAPAEAVQSHSHQESTWSILFSRYTMDGGVELETWQKNQEAHPDTQHEKHEDLLDDALIPIAFPFFFAIFLSASVFVIPVLGCFAFHLLELIWWLATHPEIKRFGRRILIIKEKGSRRRQRKLLAYSMKKPPKSMFVMPKFFRIYSEEDIPEELEESDVEGDWLAHMVPSDEEDDDRFTDEGASLSGLESEIEEIENEIEKVGEIELESQSEDHSSTLLLHKKSKKGVKGRPGAYKPI